MNAKRWISALALGALLAAQSLPAQTNRMLCGMKAEKRVEACTRCVDSGSTPAGVELRAGSCCRILPAEALESAPVVISSTRRAPAEDGATFHLTPAVVACPVPEARAFADVAITASPYLESPTRTTVLRN